MDEDLMDALEKEVEKRIDYKKANYELTKTSTDLMAELAFKSQEISRLQQELEQQKAEFNNLFKQSEIRYREILRLTKIIEEGEKW